MVRNMYKSISSNYKFKLIYVIKDILLKFMYVNNASRNTRIETKLTTTDISIIFCIFKRWIYMLSLTALTGRTFSPSSCSPCTPLFGNVSCFRKVLVHHIWSDLASNLQHSSHVSRLFLQKPPATK